MDKARRIVYSILYNLIIALNYFLLSYYLIFRVISRENLLVATLLNMVLIVAALIQEKLSITAYTKYNFGEKTKEKTLFSRIVNLYFYKGGTVKTGLYLFYILLLFCTAIVAVEPNIPILSRLDGYYSTVTYGVLILITWDKFLEQVYQALDNS